MFNFFIIVYQAVMSRLSGNGFGAKWNVSWLPEFLFAIPFGLANAWAVDKFFGFGWAIAALFIATAISYAGMQAGTWPMLRWVSHDDPNKDRSATIKPVADWIAARFGWALGDEGYSWVYAAVKGFLIGLPIGGIPLMILWPLGYEIGSHARGRVSFDPHAVSEASAGAGAGLSIVLFLLICQAAIG